MPQSSDWSINQRHITMTRSRVRLRCMISGHTRRSRQIFKISIDIDISDSLITPHPWTHADPSHIVPRPTLLLSQHLIIHRCLVKSLTPNKHYTTSGWTPLPPPFPAEKTDPLTIFTPLSLTRLLNDHPLASGESGAELTNT